MTKPRYLEGCAAGSQVDGKAPRALWQVNGNNGNVNYDNRDNNNGVVRPCRLVPRPGECKGGEVSVEALHHAWRAARRRKQPSRNQLAFEVRWMDRLLDLQQQLNTGTWAPLPTTCFIASRPKAREIHAPDFSDRVVHHLLVPQLEAIYEPSFIFDSYSNRKGKGTHKAVERVRGFVREVHSGQGGGWYLQLDVKNFFPSIHRPTLWAMLKKRLTRAGLPSIALRATHALLRHSVQAQGIHYRCTEAERASVPMHKRLENAPPGCGLPIGNLSSQFFANVYLDKLDQFVKHVLKAKRYVRFVDDFVLVHRDRAVLAEWKDRIEHFLAAELRLQLKDDMRLRPLSAGCDFLGYVVYPTHTRVRRRVLSHAAEKLQAWRKEHLQGRVATGTPEEFRRLQSVWSSYIGHMRHANTHRLQQTIHLRQPWLAPLANSKRRFSHRLEGHAVRIEVFHGK